MVPVKVPPSLSSISKGAPCINVLHISEKDILLRQRQICSDCIVHSGVPPHSYNQPKPERNHATKAPCGRQWTDSKQHHSARPIADQGGCLAPHRNNVSEYEIMVRNASERVESKRVQVSTYRVESQRRRKAKGYRNFCKHDTIPRQAAAQKQGNIQPAYCLPHYSRTHRQRKRLTTRGGSGLRHPVR